MTRIISSPQRDILPLRSISPIPRQSLASQRSYRGSSSDHNVKIDIRWGAADAARARKEAAELVALAPDVILATASPATAALQEATHTFPIVFVNVSDPFGAGYLASLAKPGSNITGFAYIEG